MVQEWEEGAYESHAERSEVILELLKAHGVDCVFASPIAGMAPLWEALAEERERDAPEAPRYVQCRPESLAVALVQGTNIVRRELGLPEARVRIADPRYAFAAVPGR